MDDRQQRFVRKLKELNETIAAGKIRKAGRDVDVLFSMAKGHPNPGVQEQLLTIVDQMKVRVEAMGRPRHRNEKRSMSIRTVSGGLPSLGKRRN